MISPVFEKWRVDMDASLGACSEECSEHFLGASTGAYGPAETSIRMPGIHRIVRAGRRPIGKRVSNMQWVVEKSRIYVFSELDPGWQPISMECLKHTNTLIIGDISPGPNEYDSSRLKGT